MCVMAGRGRFLVSGIIPVRKSESFQQKVSKFSGIALELLKEREPAVATQSENYEFVGLGDVNVHE